MREYLWCLCLPFSDGHGSGFLWVSPRLQRNSCPITELLVHMLTSNKLHVKKKKNNDDSSSAQPMGTVPAPCGVTRSNHVQQCCVYCLRCPIRKPSRVQMTLPLKYSLWNCTVGGLYPTPYTTLHTLHQLYQLLQELGFPDPLHS